MPKATIKSVREVSSEDEHYKAQNLFRHLPGKSWKTKTAGEKLAYVILELEEPHQIVGIDIGNEHSAFVEVLVGKTACTQNDFKEILITCSFMTPLESRTSDNPNRVRCFGQDALVPSIASEKWQMVKIVCTQPFNKHVQYGLAFIKLHIAENKASNVEKLSGLVPECVLKTLPENTSKSFKVGRFSLREDSPDSESETTNTLFQRWKNKNNNTTVTTAASIRDASSPAALKKLSESQSARKSFELKNVTKKNSVIDVDTEDKRLQIRDRNRSELLFGEDDEDKSTLSAKEKRLAKCIEEESERLLQNLEIDRQINKKTVKSIKTPKNGPSDDVPSTFKVASITKQNTSLNDSATTSKSVNKHKRSISPPQTSNSAKKQKPNIIYRPFNRLLHGVVLVISGIQNPDRADLRGKALALGAKYRADWDQTCTHLICAFKNTPKYNQVHGKGKIITRNWIEHCYTSKKYLPWRRFALDSTELNAPESDVELWDESLKPEEDQVSQNVVEQSKPSKVTEVENNPFCDLTSGSDTEDEIERVKEKQKIIEKSTSRVKDQDDEIFDCSTEEEDYLADKKKSKISDSGKLLFFTKIVFYLCPDVNVVQKMKLEPLIKKYGGQITKNLSEAQYALTCEGLKSLDTNKFTGVTVQPRWVYECNDLEMRVPTQRYLVE